VTTKWVRVWFVATVLCVVAGVILSVITAVHNQQGHFHSGVELGFNTFNFFTIQSNLIVGATSLLRATKVERSSLALKTFRLIGLVAITLTGVIYHVALARLLELDGWVWLSNQLVHTVVPVLAVVGWLAIGLRGLTSARIAKLSILFPAGWLGFTLIRGAMVHWYPYPFIDVTKLGYAKTILNCCWVSLLLLGAAAGFTAWDAHLGRRAAPATVSRSSVAAKTD
jgi:hypothetical protein